MYGTRQTPLGGQDMRNGSGPRANGRPSEEAESNQARAARFEDEKRRIIDSCFSKKDPDGTQLESYITHVRVNEDAQYPSSPPPPDSISSNKKNRVILVAVRRSGKVRVHKARENPSGTFSIGKTWNLDELTAIQSYTSFAPSNQQEQFEKQWAGHTGFIVSLGKPYYWQAATSKEKDFFIASLIKIFRKYTGGRIPQLVGFASQDVESMTGGTSSGHPTPNLKSQTPPMPQSAITTPRTPAPATPPVPASLQASPPQQIGNRAPSRGAMRAEPSDRNRSNSRPEARPVTREEQRIPSEDVTRSPNRYGLPQSPRDDPRNRSMGDRQANQDFSQTRSPARPGYLQPQNQQSAEPSISSKMSQSSLPRSDHRTDTPRENGMATSPFGPVKNRTVAPARSEESVRDGIASEYTGTSRPTTSSTDQTRPEPQPPIPKPTMFSAETVKPDPPPEIPYTDVESSPRRTRPQPVKRDSYHSQTTTDFVTPLQTPAPTNIERPRSPYNETPAEPQLQSEQKFDPYFHTDLVPQTTNNDLHPVSTLPTPAVPGAFDPPRSWTEPQAEAITETPKQEEEEAKKAEEEYRPGLGPMIKKKSAKDVAAQFRKAAMAVNAFKPREGGAGARLKAMQDKNSNEPDGITGVVPAPLLRGISSDSVTTPQPGLASPGLEKDRPLTPLSNNILPPTVQLQRSATEESVATGAKSIETPPTSVKFEEPPPKPIEVPREEDQIPSEKVRSSSPQRKKRQRQEADIERFCSALGLDPRVMEGRGADFNELLTEFGWEGRLPDKRKVEDFETSVRREIGRAQATGWLGHIEQQETRVLDLSRAFDKAILECEEMDGLLTLYSHELDTLQEDIEYIEAQSQGLQVQTANQKLLQVEMKSLLKTLTISSSDLHSLQSAPLDSVAGISAIEKALLLLYKAMLTIDPNIRPNKIRRAAASGNATTGLGVYADTEIGQMRAVNEKKKDYQEETLIFVRRFNQHMTGMFKTAEQRTSEDNTQSLTSGSNSSLNLPMLQTSRLELWTYNLMMLFVREVNSYEWQTLISSYEINMKSTYQDQFRDNVVSQRRTARKLTGEEQEILFTHQEKDKADESLTTTAARKLTVKRGKTVKSSALRQTFGERRDGKPDAWEVFDLVLQEHTKVIAEEQNFIVHFFHLNSQPNSDFADSFGSRSPEQRVLPNLGTQLPYEADRDIAKIVQQAVDGIYSFWATDMQGLMEWVIKQDQLQGVGVLYALERALATYEETNQEFITRTLRSIHERITGLFHKFVDEQVKAIEETKVKVSKRKGIISFMRVFPMFSAAVESMIPQEVEQKDSLELRFIINDAYNKILKAMWESLNFIAKENPVSGSGGANQSHAPASGDPEDKEALNYHILLIENMNHYLEEVQAHHNVVLEQWGGKASYDLYKHLTQYTDAVIRRPLGKWLDFLESTEALLKSNDSYASIASKPSHSRSAAKKVLASYDAKEVRKGIDTLKKRVEKHFGDVDDPANTSKSLIARVFDECNTRYAHAHDRMKTIIDSLYDGNLEMDWSKQEVAALFKR